jgi:hypothetical protein
LKEGEEGDDEWELMEGENLFKIHGMHIWNYHNEIPLPF